MIVADEPPQVLLVLREGDCAPSCLQTPVVRVEIDPVFAILEEARRQDVDIVVVGVHERSRLERLLHGSIAAGVVQKTERSVLVTPIS
jgi:nucleotide-binding universal stress UspA family protein